MTIHTDLEERWQDMADEAYEDESRELTATGARKQWAYAWMIMEAAHNRVMASTDRGTFAIEMETLARQAEEVAKWSREYARLMRPVTSDTVAASAAAIERMERAAGLG